MGQFDISGKCHILIEIILALIYYLSLSVDESRPL